MPPRNKGDRQAPRTNAALRRRAAASALLALAASAGHAAIHEQLAVSTKASSMGNAVTADPPGIMSIHYNPAGLSHLEGKHFSLGVAVPFIYKTSKFTDDPEHEGFFGSTETDPVAGREGTTDGGAMYFPGVGPIPYLAAPSLGVSYQAPGSPWTLAYGIYVPFGIGISHNKKDDPTRYGGHFIYNQHLIYAAPAVAYKVDRSFSVGMSLGLGQSAEGAKVDLRAPNDMVAMTGALGDATEGLEIPVVSELTFPQPWFGGGLKPFEALGSLEMHVKDSFVPSFNVGALWEPAWWLSFGAVYQSPQKSKMAGQYRFEYGDRFYKFVDWLGSSPTTLSMAGILNLPTRAVREQTGRVLLDWTNPTRVQLGVALRPFRRLTLTTDLNYARWSVTKADTFRFDQKIQILQVAGLLGYTGGDDKLVLQRHWKDTWHWSHGLEFRPFDAISLRLGYENRPTSIPDEYFDLTFPVTDLKSYNGGLGVRLSENLDVDLGYTYLVKRRYRRPDNSANFLNSTDFTKVIYNPYAGLDYEQTITAHVFSANLNYRW